jgi:hypothetical protein
MKGVEIQKIVGRHLTIGCTLAIVWEYGPQLACTWNFGRQFTCAWIDGSQLTTSWNCNRFVSLDGNIFILRGQMVFN